MGVDKNATSKIHYWGNSVLIVFIIVVCQTANIINVNPTFYDRHYMKE